MKVYFVIFSFWWIISRTTAKYYNHQIIIIVKGNHLPLNHNHILDKYLDETYDDITVLPSASDADTFCKNLELFSRNPSILSSPSQPILFMDSAEEFKLFMDKCNGNKSVNIEITPHAIHNNHAVYHIQAKQKVIPRRQLISNIDLGSWSTSSTKLPSTNSGMATFIYNNTIYLFGGRFSTHNKQTMEYYVVTNTFSDVMSSALSVPCEGESSFYTQINNMAYWTGKTAISRYDLSTKHLYPNIILGVNNTMNDACLASHKHLLFLVGGSYDTKEGRYPPLRKVQIYNISSELWLHGAPVMNRPRSLLTCAVHSQVEMLYAIGGANRLYSTLNYETIIEKIYVDDNILNNQWVIPKANGLYVAVVNARAVVYKEYIVVMGGYCYYYPRDICPGEVNVVQLIHVITDEVFLGPALRDANQQFGAVYNDHDSTIYVFGGHSKDTYSYLTMESDAPSSAPTATPSALPTEGPTRSTSKNPAYETTVAPTIATEFPTVSSSKTHTVTTIKPSTSPTEQKSSTMIVLVALLSVFTLLFVICLLLFIQKRKEMKSLLREQENVEEQYVQLTDGESDDDDHPDEGHMVPTKRTSV